MSAAGDAVLCVPAFSLVRPAAARLIVKGDAAILETRTAQDGVMGRVRLAPPGRRGEISHKLATSGRFGSLVVLEEGTEGKARHVYEAVICVIPVRHAANAS